MPAISFASTSRPDSAIKLVKKARQEFRKGQILYWNGHPKASYRRLKSSLALLIKAENIAGPKQVKRFTIVYDSFIGDMVRLAQVMFKYGARNFKEKKYRQATGLFWRSLRYIRFAEMLINCMPEKVRSYLRKRIVVVEAHFFADLKKVTGIHFAKFVTAVTTGQRWKRYKPRLYLKSRSSYNRRDVGSSDTTRSLPNLIKKVQRSIVTVYAVFKSRRRKAGSGFFIKGKQLIVTNYHVIAKATSLFIRDYNGKLFKISRVVAFSIPHDIAILHLGHKGYIFHHLRLSNRLPQVGEPIVVIGSPLGLLYHTVSNGIVSGVRKVKKYGYLIQFTAPISQGSSGSPLLNYGGKVIGIVTLSIKTGQNLNFAISSRHIHELLSRAKP